MLQKIKPVLKIFLFLGFGIFLVWLVLHNLTESDKQRIGVVFREADYSWIILTVVLNILSNVSRTMRWQLLLNGMGHQPGFRNTFFALMIGYLTNYALPRAGEVARCGVLAKYEKINITESLGTVVVERAVDLLSLVLVFLLVLFTQFNLIYQYSMENLIRPLNHKIGHLFAGSAFIILISVICIILVVLFVFRKSIAAHPFLKKALNLILGFWQGIKSVKTLKRPGLFIFHSILIWLIYLLMIYFAFFAIRETSHLGISPALAILVFGTLGMIAVQGGIGAYPILVGATLYLYGIDSVIGVAFGWLAWTSQTIVYLILGFVSLALIPVLNSKKNG